MALSFSSATDMAIMRSRTPSSSSFTYEWGYDVFISFRGVDTRLGFTGNLFKALRDTKEVNAFMDDQDLEPGEEIAPTLIKAIQESRIALVIFSKNYAASTFCLEELVNIVECSVKKGMLVWPVFYQVDPAEVRYQKGSYAEALVKHEARFEKEKIEKWRAALKKAADRSGSHFRSDGYQYEYQFIDKIIQDISKKISSWRDGDKNQIISNVDDKYITQHNRQPKPQSSRFIKYRGGEHLPDKRVHYDKTSHKFRDLTTLKIAFHHATENDVAIHTIRLPKQSVVEDVINDLKSKVELSYPQAELRLLGVSDHTIKKIFSLREKIENIADKYETIRAEEIPVEEKILGSDDKLIHVYHFKTYGAPNLQIQNFGDPFFLVIHMYDKPVDVKLWIQKKLRIPYDEISKWKFASVRFNHAEYLDDIIYPDSVSRRFKSGITYGDWEQYLGLEHDDDAPPKRSYAAN